MPLAYELYKLYLYFGVDTYFLEVKFVVKQHTAMYGSGLMHRMFSVSTDCIKKPHGGTDLHHQGLYCSVYDVCTAKSPPMNKMGHIPSLSDACVC